MWMWAIVGVALCTHNMWLDRQALPIFNKAVSTYWHWKFYY